MVNRSIAAPFRLCAAGFLLVVGTTALMHVVGASTAAAATSTPALLGWGVTPTFQSLPGGVTATAVAGDFSSAYAIGSDGKLYAWDENSFGNDLGGLGDGNTTNSYAPVVVSLPSGVSPTAIAAGEGTGYPDSGGGYVIGSDGSLYAWGYNADGELGDGTNTGPDSCNNGGGPVACSTTPVKVALPTGVTPRAIATAGGSAFAIGSDGHLYAWGYNGSGELGDGTTTSTDTPVVVSLPSGVTPTAIAGTSQAVYAIGSNGHLYAWGDNVYGELGNGTDTGPDLCGAIYPCSTVPVQVSLPSGVTPTAIAGGGPLDGYAIGSDGHLYAWGYNAAGELGDGTDTGPDLCSVPEMIGTPQQLPCSTVPIQVSLPSGVTPTAVAQNGYGGSVIGSDNNIYAWGGGNLGNGSSTGSDSPVAVSLPTGSSPVALGQDPEGLSYAIVSVPVAAPAITTNPKSQVVPYGQTATFTAAASGFPPPTVQWRVSTDGGSAFSPVSGATSDTLSIAGTTLAENGNEYEAVFTNLAGSATTSAATLTVTVPAPTTTVALPSSGATLSGDTWLDASAQSPVGIASVSYEVSGGSVSDLVVSASSDTAYGWIGAWDTTDVPNGTYILKSVATDTEGDTATSPGVSVTVDNVALHTEVLVPSNGATVSSSAVLDASAAGTSDITGVTFEVSGGTLSDHVVGTAGATLYGWIAVWDTSTVANGTYTLQSVATEVGGTMATSTGITVTVNNAG
jgi:alpha-tubulin suppressor-like RCC1 family protein